MKRALLLGLFFIGICTQSFAQSVVEYSDKFEIDVQFGNYYPDQEPYWQFNEQGTVPVTLKKTSVKLLKSPSSQLTNSYYDYMDIIENCHQIEPDLICSKQSIMYDTEITPDTAFFNQHLTVFLSEQNSSDTSIIKVDYEFNTDQLTSESSAKNDYILITTYEFEVDLSTHEFYLEHISGSSSYTHDADATAISINNLESITTNYPKDINTYIYNAIIYDHNLINDSLNKDCNWVQSEDTFQPSNSWCLEPFNSAGITIDQLVEAPTFLDGPTRSFKVNTIHSILETNNGLDGVQIKEDSAGSISHLLFLSFLLLIRRSARHG